MSPRVLPLSSRSFERSIGLSIAVVVHIVALIGLLSYAPVRRTVAAAAPAVVAYLIAAEVPARVDPPTPTRKPMPTPSKSTAKASVRKPVEPSPIPPISSETPTPLQAVVPELVMPSPPAEATAAVAPIPPAAAAPSPVTPPSFNAAYLDNPAPAYPTLARRAGEQGRVLLRVRVSAGGTAEVVEIHSSSNSPRLDNAALETVKRWRFVPARQGDVATAAWVLVPINFTLES